MPKRGSKRGFTLIELLVVVAIISLLSSIVFASLNSARAKSRDAKRRTELKQIYTAMEFYYDKFGTYVVSGSGWRGGGAGWFSFTDNVDYVVAIGQGLTNAGFLGGNPHDPSGRDTGVTAGATGYMLYPCSSGNGFYVFAGIENPTALETSTYTAGTACVGSSLNVYGMNAAMGHN